MRNYIGFSILILAAGCQQQVRKENMTSTGTVHYIRTHHQVPTPKAGYDTLKLTKGQLYQQDTIHHPLRQFYLSYPEWEKIRCIIAVDETDYWEKAMIGLIEKTGALRIQYGQQKIHLSPVNKVKTKEGEHKQVFKNDTLEIQLSARLKSQGIQRSLTGNGTLTVKHGNQTIVETVFLVQKMKQ